MGGKNLKFIYLKWGHRHDAIVRVHTDRERERDSTFPRKQVDSIRQIRKNYYYYILIKLPVALVLTRVIPPRRPRRLAVMSDPFIVLVIILLMYV